MSARIILAAAICFLSSNPSGWADEAAAEAGWKKIGGVVGRGNIDGANLNSIFREAEKYYGRTGPVTGAYWPQTERGDRISSSDLKLLQEFKGLEVLYLSVFPARFHPSPTAGMQELKELKKLRLLHLSCGATDAGLKVLRELSELEDLHLYSDRLTDAGVKELTALRKLHTFRLGGVKRVTDAGMKHIAGLSNLRTLGVFAENVTDNGVKELAGLGKLERLSVHTKATGAGISQLRVLSNLRELNIDYQSKVTTLGVEKLGQLRTLVITGPGITDESLASLRGLHELERLLLDASNITDAGLKDLYYLKGLKGLHVGSQCKRVTDAAVYELRAAMPNADIRRWGW